jgi:fructose transport system permease protein
VLHAVLARINRADEGEGRSALARARAISTLGPLLALILASIFFTARTDRFLTTDNLSLVVQQVAVVGIIAIGQTLVILTAGIDLSAGAVMAFGTIVMTHYGNHLWIGARPWPCAGDVVRARADDWRPAHIRHRQQP